MTTRVPRPHSRSFEEIVALAATQTESDDFMRAELIRARKRAGLTQKAVADAMGVSQATVSAFERHENDPRLSTLRRYAVAVGVAINHEVAPVARREREFELPVPSFVVTAPALEGGLELPVPSLAVTMPPARRQAFSFAEVSPVEFHLSVAHAADSTRDDFTTAA